MLITISTTIGVLKYLESNLKFKINDIRNEILHYCSNGTAHFSRRHYCRCKPCCKLSLYPCCRFLLSWSIPPTRIVTRAVFDLLERAVPPLHLLLCSWVIINRKFNMYLTIRLCNYKTLQNENSSNRMKAQTTHWSVNTDLIQKCESHPLPLDFENLPVQFNGHSIQWTK